MVWSKEDERSPYILQRETIRMASLNSTSVMHPTSIPQHQLRTAKERCSPKFSYVR